MAELKLHSISYHYPDSDRLVLNDFNAQLLPGRTYWVSGPNGVGKTTLLEICTGLRLPITGEVTFDNARVSPAEVSYLPAELPLYPELTIAEHEALVSELWEFKDTARESFADRYFELVTLLGVGERHEALSDFSQGMREKVAIALTLARPSPVVLLDEPFGALDARSLELCQEIVRAEAATRILVIVSHLTTIMSALNPLPISLTEGEHQ